MVYYYCCVVSLSLKCTILRYGAYWSKIAEKTYPTLICTFLGGDPLQIFWLVIPCQKLESWGYQVVYISWSCFLSARHNTGVWQTDRHIAVTKTALCIASLRRASKKCLEMSFLLALTNQKYSSTVTRGGPGSMHPGKSWNLFPGFSRPWKVLENEDPG